MDINDDEKRGKQASVDGFAHEHIVFGILMKRYHHVFLSDFPLSPFDLTVMLNADMFIRVQIKTASRSVSFQGGSRGGVDREYKAGVKTFTQSTETSDIVIGLHTNQSESYSYDLYIIPTILVEHLQQKSISITKIESLKNNYEMLENCKNHEWVLEKAKELGLLTP